MDKNEYNRKRNAELRKNKVIKQWKADLPTEEKDLYDKILKKNNMSKPEFLRLAFEKIFNVKKK